MLLHPVWRRVAGDQALLSHVNIDKAEAVTDVNTDKAKKLLKDRELC
jgi:hypothetical protein